MASGKYLNLMARAIIVILPLRMLACQKAAPVDPGIEDEEYRVMTAVLKDIRFHRLLHNSDSFSVPNFSDTSDRPTYRRVPILRKPVEFWHAKDTIRARALLSTMQNIFGDAKYYLAVSAKTVSTDHMGPVWGDEESFVEANCPEMLQDIRSKSKDTYDLSRTRFGDSLIVRLVGLDEFDDWLEFYEALPLADGQIWLTRVGFSTDMKQAAVYIFWKPGPFGGHRRLRYLEKHEGKWEVININDKTDD